MFMVIYAVLHRHFLSLEEAQGELIMTHLQVFQYTITMSQHTQKRDIIKVECSHHYYTCAFP